MSSDFSGIITRDNLNFYLNELSKEYKRLGGRNTPIEITLIGGAVIVEKYGFRNMTTDVDALIPKMGVFKDAVNAVGDRYGLSNGWLNSDFEKTASYSPNIIKYSVPYRTFNQVLQVRMMTDEYLIAMKLRSGREYKNDLSDIIGILADNEKNNTPIMFADVDQAVNDLYGGWDDFPPVSLPFIKEIMSNGDYDQVYDTIRQTEQETKDDLLRFEQDYPNVLSDKNLNDILRGLREKKEHMRGRGGMELS